MSQFTLLLVLAAALSGPARPGSLPVKKDTVLQQYQLYYDPSRLRIPGNSLPIGIVTVPASGPTLRTKGFLKGNEGWGKYKIEVTGGIYSNGEIKIGGNKDYKKTDSITVSVYTRKWFLGGKDRWLLTQKIPYDQESGINILTTGSIGRAPGAHIQFGIRTWYDNKMFIDEWFPAKGRQQDFIFELDGGHISRSKGDLKIDTDPANIHNDKVKLIAMLAKDSAIRDTLQIAMDYAADYECKVQSNGNGHDLYVSADAYFDSLIHTTLLKIEVFDSTGMRRYRYLVNTNGGSLSISSQGGNGLDGNNGLDGLRGLDGASAPVTVDVQTVVGPDGKTETTTKNVQGQGGDGARGGDGNNGGDGWNGSDGGNIRIDYTPVVTPFLTRIRAQSISGSGGTGGRGGQGGTGGMGGLGNPSGQNGLKGFDGRAGFDGSPGRKGKVIFSQSTVLRM